MSSDQMLCRKQSPNSCSLIEKKQQQNIKKVTLPTTYRYSENVHHHSGREKVLLSLRAQWHFQTWKIKDFGPAFINKCLIEGKSAAFFSPQNHYTRLAENHALVHNKTQSVEDLEGEGGGQVPHQAICCRAQRRDMVTGAFLTSHFSCSFSNMSGSQPVCQSI